MKNFEDLTTKLDSLKFDDMYNNDFFLTWEKSEDELATQNDKVAELTEQFGKLTVGNDNSNEIDAKAAEISAAGAFC